MSHCVGVPLGFDSTVPLLQLRTWEKIISLSLSFFICKITNSRFLTAAQLRDSLVCLASTRGTCLQCLYSHKESIGRTKLYYRRDHVLRSSGLYSMPLAFQAHTCTMWGNLQENRRNSCLWTTYSLVSETDFQKFPNV